MTYPTPVKPATPVPGSTPDAPWRPVGPAGAPAPATDWREPAKS